MTGGDPHVKPLVHRAENPASLTLRGDETNGQIAATLDAAWEAGYDAVLIKNYTGHGGKSGAVLAVKDPAQLRSPYAEFDPAKIDFNDLLAGAVGIPAAGVVGTAVARRESQ
jgi:hypothetical protein